MRASMGRAWAVFGLAAALYAATTHGRLFAAGNDASRWAQIEAVVDLGSPTIERSRFRDTVDRVVVGGREYSNKPPFLSLVGAALYAPLAGITGWRLGDAESAGRVIWLLTWLLVGWPAAALVALFDRQLGRFATLTARNRSVLTLALGGGTLLFSYAGTLNNHVPAAALLFLAFVLAADGRAFGCGASCGLAGAIDLLPGFGAVPFLALVLLFDSSATRVRTARFAAGLGPGVAALVGSNLWITGTPLPPKLLPGAVDLSAQAGPSLAGVVLPQSWTYPFEILFGGHGLFLVSPILLLGVVGLVSALRRAPWGSPWLWRALAGTAATQIAAHALLAGSYGGWSYGFRYLIPIQALLLLAAPMALERRLGRLIAAPLVALSILFAALGAYHPWPPGFEQASTLDPVAARVTQPIGGNAAAWCADHLPGSAVARALADRYVDGDAAEQRQYFALFFAAKGDLDVWRRFRP